MTAAINREKTGEFETPLCLADELNGHLSRLSAGRRGKPLGISMSALPKLDQAIGGLRGLMVLAAAPNVGKTALAVQMGLDAVQSDPDACFLNRKNRPICNWETE